VAARHRHLLLNFGRQPSVQLQRESLALLVAEQKATIFIPRDRSVFGAMIGTTVTMQSQNSTTSSSSS
jgi:hypothetical protein